MVVDRSHESDGIYMTVAQYLALDDATDAKYEYDNGYVYMLRPPSSAYDEYAILDLAGGSEYQAVEVYRREGSFWRQYLYQSGDIIELTSIGVSFSFDALYRRIPM